MKNNGQGTDTEYEELLDELAKDGIIPDAKTVGEQSPFAATEQKHTNAALLASVPNINHYYGKDDKDKALILDLMNRTYFRSRNEIIHFLDWVDWCEEFEVGFDACLRYLVAVNSEGGKAREQYADAITTMRLKGYGRSSNNSDRFKREHSEGKLS